ncbi:hypothetical protein IM40_07345 [Candidatus Paracaedimonas acanthamoebae]|nr:hypothetical protein IM40_07345 [Candidatus Paracaedimonas acanthamoebae]
MLKFFITLVFITFVSWQNDGHSSFIEELNDGSCKITSKQKYPQQVFDVINFIKDVQEKLRQIDKISSLSIDLSGDISVNSRSIELLLNELNRTSLPIQLLNLSHTSIEANIIQLLSKSRINCVDISDTDAAESEELSFNEPIDKFIFIPESDLYFIENLNKTTLNLHQRYYDEKNTIQGMTAKKYPSVEGMIIPNLERVCGLTSSYDCGDKGLTLPASAQICGLTG